MVREFRSRFFPLFLNFFSGSNHSVRLLKSEANEKGIRDNTFIVTSNKAKSERLNMWAERWDMSKIGWHKSDVNEHLLKHFDYLQVKLMSIKISDAN